MGCCTVAISENKERMIISVTTEQALWVRIEAAKRKINTGEIVG
jgi:hypothetical protein